MNQQKQHDVLCISHLRWNFVFQRPQHLMSRFAAERRVFYMEEPLFDCAEPYLETRVCPRTQVRVLTPHLATELERNEALERMLTDFMVAEGIRKPIVWLYTPMALEFL